MLLGDMLALLAAVALLDSPHPYLHMPSIDSFAKLDPEGTTILPEGRLLRPAGWAEPIGRWPHGLAVSPNADLAFVAIGGRGAWVDDWTSREPKIEGYAPPASGGRSNAGAVAFSPDGRTVYWSSGESGGVYVCDARTRQEPAFVPLNAEVGGRKFEDSFVNDLAVSADGRYVYCADFTNFRVAVIDAARRQVVGSVGVGRCPFGLAVSGNRVYVANIGQFEYSSVVPDDGTGPDKRGLTFPPFGYPSKEAENGVYVEGRHVKGLGSPLAPEAFSVYGLDVSQPTAPKVVFRSKTGTQIGAKSVWGAVVGGSGPNYVVASDHRVYVSNSNDDTVQVLDAATGKVRHTISLEPSPLVHGLRGVGPAGMALSRDGERLYVAESGLNAIAVIDTATSKVLGLIPTAWYPYRVALSREGSKLACICFKGFGNGPKGLSGPHSPYQGMVGSFHTIPIPSGAELAMDTRTVLQNNGIVDASADLPKLASPVWSSVPGVPSKQIKYVVFITKENHTFDTIFDRIPGTDNDPDLLRWGLDQTISASGQPTLRHVSVMRNHNKLARQFVVSDNFYMEPEASGVGHRWLVGVQPNNWCQYLYTLGFDFKLDSTAPGRRESFGSNASLTPEDYPEAGSMWDQLARNHIKFRNYGEGFEFANAVEDEHEEKTGVREVINMPMPKVLFDNTSRDFPNFNLNIPDMYRAEWFEKEVRAKYLSGKEAFPSFINIAICCDHGTSPHPKQGYPYVASYMADDDWALGKIVEFLSHTPEWKHMAIFVTQDDAGGENDHIDAQRSVQLIISPYVKHGYVSHRHTTITSMHRTLYEIFGLPPLNMFDALSNDFSDCFTDKPDFSPYSADPIDLRLFNWPAIRNPKDPDYRLARKMPTVKMDDWDDDDR